QTCWPNYPPHWTVRSSNRPVCWPPRTARWASSPPWTAPRPPPPGSDGTRTRSSGPCGVPSRSVVVRGRTLVPGTVLLDETGHLLGLFLFRVDHGVLRAVGQVHLHPGAVAHEQPGPAVVALAQPHPHVVAHGADLGGVDPGDLLQGEGSAPDRPEGDHHPVGVQAHAHVCPGHDDR